MQWSYTWGPKYKSLKEIELASGETPKAILDAPVLHGLANEVRDAYDVLASRRTSGFSPNPIQLSEILCYVSLYGEPTISLVDFIELIGVMDTKYLELVHGHKS